MKHGFSDVEERTQELGNVGLHQPVKKLRHQSFTKTMFRGRNKVARFYKKKTHLVLANCWASIFVMAASALLV